MTQDNKNQKKPKPASTVILIRDNEGELQVYLMKRSADSSFMADMYVFPGGTVDEVDMRPDIWENRTDLDPEDMLKRLGGNLSFENVLSNGVTAIRETFEEAGVFIAHRSSQMKDDLERVCGLREEVGLEKGWLVELVTTHGWILEFSKLYRWSHWITPALMKHRFDTRFFIAHMPPGQECRPDTRETIHGIWMNPLEGLEGNLKGDISLSPPTLITLHELSHFKSLDDLKREIERREWGETRYPRLVPLDKGAVILQPWDPMINQEEVGIDPSSLHQKVLPLGEPFSRVWLNKGLWKPIGI